MKDFFKEIGKALGYFLVYLIAQVVVGLAAGLIIPIYAGANGGADATVLNDILARNIGLINLVAAVVVLTTYFIITKVRKHKFIEEASVKKVSAKSVFLSLVAAAGCIGFLSFGLEVFPIPESLVEGMKEGNAQLANASVWQAIVSTSIVVPILEEVVFRGFVFSRLNRVMSTWVAILITSIVFGLCHGQILWAAWAALLGVVMNILRVKTGSLIPGIVMHIANNSFSTFLNLSGYEVPKNMYIPIVILGAILLVIALVFIGEKTEDNRVTEVEVISANV
ncbi:MAG: CPBP family intramembrane metalloprotease [Eubacterium sp.]|nr:CPBP family intramembrane metalloprotease [Eubacterium sp.]